MARLGTCTAESLIAFLVALFLAASLACAQEDRGEQTPELPPATTVPIVAGAAVTGDKGLTKEVIVEAEQDNWWQFQASTGWDSLYMFRGVNVLGNGNGIYWISGSAGVNPWTGGTFTVGAWYGIGSHYDSALHQETYAELDVFADYTHEFGPLALSFGYSGFYYPNSPDAAGNDWTWQNEISVKAAWCFALGRATVTPSAIYYYDLGPEWGEPHGITNGGSSFLTLRLDAHVPVWKEAVALEPYTAFGINFGFNNRWIEDDTAQYRFNGGNNWELGVAVPVAFTGWFSVAPYVAYSHQWQNLPSYNEGNPFTAANTWWAGVKATLAF